MNIESKLIQPQPYSRATAVEESLKGSRTKPAMPRLVRERQMVWVTTATKTRASEPYLVVPHASVRHLKSLIQLSFEIPVSEQVLKMGQQVIEDNKTFAEQGISDQARLTVASKSTTDTY